MKNKHNTVTEELQQIADILGTNKTTTILELFEIGYDFNKSIEEQTSEVDELLSQMLLNRVTTGETIEPVETVLEEDEIEFKRAIEQNKENILHYITTEKINTRKYAKGKTPTKRKIIVDMFLITGQNYVPGTRYITQKKYDEILQEIRHKYEEEVIKVVDDYFEYWVEHKEESEKRMFNKMNEIYRETFAIFKRYNNKEQ